MNPLSETSVRSTAIPAADQAESFEPILLADDQLETTLGSFEQQLSILKTQRQLNEPVEVKDELQSITLPGQEEFGVPRKPIKPNVAALPAAEHLQDESGIESLDAAIAIDENAFEQPSEHYRTSIRSPESSGIASTYLEQSVQNGMSDQAPRINEVSLGEKEPFASLDRIFPTENTANYKLQSNGSPILRPSKTIETPSLANKSAEIVQAGVRIAQTEASAPIESLDRATTEAASEPTVRQGLGAFTLESSFPTAKMALSETSEQMNYKGVEINRQESEHAFTSKIERPNSSYSVLSEPEVEQPRSLMPAAQPLSASLQTKEEAGPDQLELEMPKIPSGLPINNSSLTQPSRLAPTPQTLPVGNANLITEAAVTVRETGSQVEVSLSPDDLGRLSVKLDQGSQGPILILSAERPETQEMIRRQMEQLQQQLRSMGFDDLTFAFDGQHDDSQAQEMNLADDTEDQIVRIEHEEVLQVQILPLSTGLDIRI